MHTDRWLDVLFGMGDDDFPYWLMAVRLNVLLFLVCSAVVLWRTARRAGRDDSTQRREIALVMLISAIGAGLRFLTVSNLFDFGGIPYSRLLLGYRGHFAAAQFYSLFYELTSRDIEHGILLNRIAGTLTIPLVYVICRRIERGWFPAVASLLLAVYPLHVLFSASDVLPVFSLFLTASSFALILGVDDRDESTARLRYLGGFAGIALLSQVRYENVLFVAPAILVLISRRGRLRARVVLPSLAVSSGLLAFYGACAMGAGLSFQNPIRIPQGTEMVVEHVLLNPFIAAPALLAVTAIGTWYGGTWFAVGALVSWTVALTLPVAAESGHGAARVFASWLIPLLPLAAYGPARWLGASSRMLRLGGGLMVLSFVALPVVGFERLRTQHLEMLEHEFFRERLVSLPPAVTHLIVPDDEILRRRTASTTELDNKYAFTLAAMPSVRDKLELVRLTQHLESGDPNACSEGRCAFFFGLPCLEQSVYPDNRAQCEALLARYDAVITSERQVRAAPFVSCSIYLGELWRRLCEPATRRQRFAFYSIR